jgi:monovalent cation/hydrogen antiporter
MDIATAWFFVFATLCASALLAHRLGLAPPFICLLGGVALAFVPGLHVIQIDPHYMLLLFLPPILMEAAFFTSLRDFRYNLRPILHLALSMVVLTTLATGLIFHAFFPEQGLFLGLLLGAIISPPDAAAATASLKNIRLPKRVVTILEGESLVNDASGLVLYKFMLAAVLAGSFYWRDALAEFTFMVVAGIGIGVVCGAIFIKIFPFIREQSVAIALSFIPPYAAFMLAEHVHASGVLAVVACGLLVGWHAATLFTAQFRIPAEAIWKMLVFFLNALAFTLVGLQLPTILRGIQQYDSWLLAAMVIAILVSVTALRIAFVFAIAYGSRALCKKLRLRDPYPPWQNLFIIGWTSMRGVVTLATALAIPMTLPGGDAFPHRDLLLFLAVSIILSTMLIQSLTLPYFARKLTLSTDHHLIYEEWMARKESALQAMRVIEALADDATIHRPALSRIRSHYEERLEALGDGPNTPIFSGEDQLFTKHPLMQAEHRIWREVLAAERAAIVDLRKKSTLHDDIMNELFREMDLLSSRFYYEERR